MNYIDELYRQMIASQGRLPSSVNDPNAVLNPLGASMPQKQKEIVIESNPVMPIEYPEGYKVQVPQSEIIRENRNEAILPLMQEAKSMGQNVEALTRQTDADRNALRQAVQKMRDIDFKEYQNPEIDTLIKAQQEKMLTQGADIPERDMATELILNLGPALGGMFLGEAGALAAPAAFKQSREIYEGQRKEQIERVKLLKENSEKKLKALIDAKKSGQEAFDKTQERELKKAQYELEGGKALAQQSAQELDRTEQRLLTLNTEIARQRGQGATDIGKMELEKEKEAGKTKRANIIATGQALKEATTLRKEFNSDPIVKNFKDIEQSYKKMIEISKKPSAAGDISMIFSYMRMLDPTSTIREGEFATAQQAAGIPDRIVNTYNKLISGERLSPDQRKDFLNQAENIYKSQQALVSRIESDYIKMAPSYGANPNLVVPRKSEQIKKTFDKDVLDYAAKYKITPEQALAIKEKRAK